MYRYWLGIAIFSGLVFFSSQTRSAPENEIASGEKLYLKHCKKCHGTDGTKGAFKAKDLQKSVMADSTMFKLIREGKKKMPSYKKKMDIHETFVVIKYVKSLRTTP